MNHQHKTEVPPPVVDGQGSERSESTHPRHASHPSDQDDITDISLADIGILDGLLARPLCPLHQVSRQRLELCPRQLHVHVLWSTGVHGEEWKVDVRLSGSREEGESGGERRGEVKEEGERQKRKGGRRQLVRCQKIFGRLFIYKGHNT